MRTFGEAEKQIKESFDNKTREELEKYAAKLLHGCWEGMHLTHIRESEARWFRYCAWRGSEEEWLRHDEVLDLSKKNIGPTNWAKRDFQYKRKMLQEQAKVKAEVSNERKARTLKVTAELIEAEKKRQKDAETKSGINTSGLGSNRQPTPVLGRNSPRIGFI